ncbi:beta-lactamase [Phlyctema vagabunda]|uniref:Beta-lactamase n=1 Tax=Phlyctema vagabunda TaxID=108571 RepID=A0ABR4PLE0_9HELO
MPRFNQEIEDRIVAALKAVQERDSYGINEAARDFQVNGQALRRRLKGSKSVKNNGGHNKALNSEQMIALTSFIDRQISLGIPTSKDMVVTAAQRILHVAGSNHELGRHWYTRWIKDHPQYHIPARMGPKPHNPDFFDHLETLIKTQFSGDNNIDDMLIHLGSPIVSVGVLDAGEITSRVLGSPKLSNHDPRVMGAGKLFNTETLFQACCISKPLTALAVIKLAQEGKLNLDMPISQYLSQDQISSFSIPSTHILICQISIKMLLSHTSGLSVDNFTGYFTSKVPSLPDILRGESPANNAPIRLLRMPGQEFSYSSGGFAVIQLILETIMQKPFAQIMDEVVLAPLKMTRSTFQILPAIEKNYAPAYLTGRNLADPDHHLFPESAAAGLWSTPADLLRAVAGVQWSLESNDFLDRRWAEIMLQQVNPIGMALGWFAKKDGTSFGHPGSNNPGYRCFVMGYADLSKERRVQMDEDREADNEDSSIVPKDCGISVMVSSELGGEVREKILAAIPYLKGWPSISHSMGLSEYIIPFVDRSKQIDERAMQWCGAWKPGPWTLVNLNGLSIQFSHLIAMHLVPAAIAPKRYDEGISIDLVVDGLEIMIRLGWKDGGHGTQIMELWQSGKMVTLQREPSWL